LLELTTPPTHFPRPSLLKAPVPVEQ
jgi:hypothetical protein